MARVAVFIEKLPPAQDEIAVFAYDLIRSLADQQHDIRIFSTYEEGSELPPAHPRIEILRPFRTWSWMEVPKLLPLLTQFKPEIVHIIQPHAQMTTLKFMKFTSALPQLLAMLGAGASVLSIFDLQPGAQFRTNIELAKICSFVSVRNETQKKLLIENEVPDKKIKILPVSSPLDSRVFSDSAEAFEPSLESFLARHPQFFYVPGSLNSYLSIPKLLKTLSLTLAEISNQNSHGLVVGGTLSQLSLKDRQVFAETLRNEPWGSRVYFTGEPTTELETQILQKTLAVLALGLRADGLSFLRLLRGALRAPASLILSERQVASDPLPWQHGQNALICNSPEDLSWAISSLLQSSTVAETLRRGAAELGHREATDDPGNLMSRWYAHMLQGHTFAD